MRLIKKMKAEIFIVLPHFETNFNELKASNSKFGLLWYLIKEYPDGESIQFFHLTKFDKRDLKMDYDDFIEEAESISCSEIYNYEDFTLSQMLLVDMFQIENLGNDKIEEIINSKSESYLMMKNTVLKMVNKVTDIKNDELIIY